MLIDILFVCFGMLLLIWGTNKFVHGATSLAHNLRIPTVIIGSTIVSLATSAPEIQVSITAALKNASNLAIGNAIGSNIANIGLVLGSIAIIKPMNLKSALPKNLMPVFLFVSFMTILLFYDGTLSQIEGILLMIGLIIVLIRSVKIDLRSKDGTDETIINTDSVEKNTTLLPATMMLIIGLLLLIFGAELIVTYASKIARSIGVSETIIGITLVAIGTSLPELSVSIISVLKGQVGLAIGNIIGSNIYNILAVIGIAGVSIKTPIELDPNMFKIHLMIMLCYTSAIYLLRNRSNGEIGRIEGLILVSTFITYISYITIQNV